MDSKSLKKMQDDTLKYVHRAQINRNEIKLDGFVLKGKKQFQLKYPSEISAQELTDIGLAELYITDERERSIAWQKNF